MARQAPPGTSPLLCSEGLPRLCKRKVGHFLRSWGRSMKTASLSDFNHHPTPCGYAWSLDRKWAGLGEMTVLKGIFLLPTSLLLEFPAALKEAAPPACSGCGLVWRWLLSVRYLHSLQQQRVSSLRSGALVNCGSSLFLLVPLQDSKPPLPLGWAGLLPLCTRLQIGSSHLVLPTSSQLLPFCTLTWD